MTSQPTTEGLHQLEAGGSKRPVAAAGTCLRFKTPPRALIRK